MIPSSRYKIHLNTVYYIPAEEAMVLVFVHIRIHSETLTPNS